MQTSVVEMIKFDEWSHQMVKPRNNPDRRNCTNVTAFNRLQMCKCITEWTELKIECSGRRKAHGRPSILGMHDIPMIGLYRV